MRSITDEEVIFIDHDLTARGIVLEELRDNLIDHICCVIEHESTIEEDFYKCYERVLPQFFEEELQEIQRETDNLLQFKNFYTMKKIMNISGISTVFLILVGAFFKAFHLPGAAVILILGGISFVFFFLPILILIKLKDDETVTDKIVFSGGLLISMAIVTGVIFKIMHWPGANYLMYIGTIVFTLLYVPTYFFTRIRRPEARFNTIVSSVMMIAFGGILYALFDLSYSSQYESQMKKNHYFLHDNSVRLFESNTVIYENIIANNQAKSLHEQTKDANIKLEIVVDSIVKLKSTNGFNDKVYELILSLEQYNTSIQSMDQIADKTIDDEALRMLNKLNVELSLNVLARIQQQLAVNENAFLLKQLSTNKSFSLN